MSDVIRGEKILAAITNFSVEAICDVREAIWLRRKSTPYLGSKRKMRNFLDVRGWRRIG